MLSRIMLRAASALAGVIVVVSAASAAAPDDDPGADAASSPLPELTVAPPTDYPDVRLLNGYAFSSQAAFDPAHPRRLVVGIVLRTGCYVKASTDGGRTWGALVPLPQLAGAECWYDDPPAVIYAAGGGRLYAAYPYRKSNPYRSGVAVSMSTDQGATWSGPTSALPERDLYDDGGYGGDVHLAAARDGSRIYLAANWRGYHATSTLLFASSGNQGSSWTPGKRIIGDFPPGSALSGFALAAGRGGNVLVAHGWGEGIWTTAYSSKVQVARSADHGASFLYDSADQSESLAFGDPDIKIGPFGTAHLVYAKASNQGDAILYKYSYPPYSTWSAEAVRLDDDVPQANVSRPHLAVGACGKASVLHATWLEYLGYRPSEILYTRKVAQPGYAWSEPLKIGKLNGVSGNGLAAAGYKAFSIFSGRTAPYLQDKWGIAGSRVSSGVTCP